MENKIVHIGTRRKVDQVLEASENNVARREKLLSILQDMLRDDRLVNQFLCELMPKRAA